MESKPQARIYTILHKVQQIWEKNPELRLGQIMTNVEYESNVSASLFYIEDKDLLNGLVKLEDKLK